MPNSDNEAKRMHREIVAHDTLLKKVFMDSKADNQKMYYDLKENHRAQLVTIMRRGMIKSPSRKQMFREMNTGQNRKDYQKRSTTVEPMQGLVNDIFELSRCWMRGNDSNRRLFAAMGIAVQMAQLSAYRNKQSTWNIKSLVLGVRETPRPLDYFVRCFVLA